MLDAVHLLVTTYRLYGVVFALRENDVLHVYAGGEQTLERNKLYEGIIRFDRYDPFCWTIENNITQIFLNIRENPNYTPIPVLENAESVMIMPIVYQDQTLGALGICGVHGVKLTSEDLIVFEPFAAQLAVALQKVAQYQAQYVNVQSSRHLLKGWERFANLSRAHEVAQVLRELVEEVPHAGQALVWFYDSPITPNETLLIDCSGEEPARVFNKMFKQGIIQNVVETSDYASSPRLFDGRAVETGPLLPLFHAMMSPQVLFVPITVSDVFVGGLFVGAGAGKVFTQEDINLIENLVRTAAQMFYRIALTTETWEKSARLEAIIRSISEGIFFVDEHDHVAFCNPQFGEMTGIQPSEVLQKPVETLLRLLSTRSNDPQRTAASLQTAQTTVSRPNVEDEDYPIVDLILADSDTSITIEFVKIEALDSSKLNWVGLIRDSAQSGRDDATRSLLREMITDHLRMPYAQMRTQIGMLTEQHGAFSHRERDRLLRELEVGVEQFGQLWLNFLDLANMELGGVILSRDLVDIGSIVQRLVQTRVFLPYAQSVRLDLRSQVPQIKGDEYRLERAISNMLYVLVGLMHGQELLKIHTEMRGKELALVFSGLSAQTASAVESLLAGPRTVSGQVTPEAFALYVSSELVNRHGGRLLVAQDGDEYEVVLALPGGTSIAPAAQQRLSTVEIAAQPDAPTRHAGMRAPTRGLKTILLVEGRSSLVKELNETLTAAEYDVISYRVPEEALRDINATRFDLVIIDTNLRDMNGIDLCSRIHSRTETPIILLADKVSETDKVRGLNAGADDYLARPISKEEMMARLNTIFKRLHITDRAREPLQIGDLYVDFARREVFLANKPLELTRIEYDLLHILITNRGQVLTHKQLLEKVWGPEYANETQYLWVNISRLRKKLEPRQDSPRYIQNQLGIGYMFVEP